MAMLFVEAALNDQVDMLKMCTSIHVKGKVFIFCKGTILTSKNRHQIKNPVPEFDNSCYKC